jgi:hypothetical protein
MKKLLVMFAIAGTLVACNNSSDGSTTGDTTNTMTPGTGDSNMMSTPAMGDSANHMGDSATMRSGDSSAHK